MATTLPTPALPSPVPFSFAEVKFGTLSAWIWLPLLFLILVPALAISFRTRTQLLSTWSTVNKFISSRLPSFMQRGEIRLDNESNFDENDELPMNYQDDYRPLPTVQQRVILALRFLASSSTAFINRVQNSSISDLVVGRSRGGNKYQGIRRGEGEGSFSRPYLNGGSVLSGGNLFKLEEEDERDALELSGDGSIKLLV